jgi:16S rRNA (uracil1498-N3)-methyltransferase
VNSFIANITGTTAELRSDESWHCAKVLRKKSGDKILVIDGMGAAYEAVLVHVTEKKCTAEISGPFIIQPALPYHLHIAIAPTKQIDRIEWMIEKCVEIGIHEISFFTSKNSERTQIKHERMVSIVESAVKQSLQARIPTLHQLQDFTSLLSRVKSQNCFIAHCEQAEKINLKQIDFTAKPLCFLIGPEGDFSPAEISSAISAGATAITLGETRLRTETAGLYVCQAASLLSI